MKRFTTTWTLVLMAVLSFSLMSCQDDDERLAYYLDGVWQGNITTDSQDYSTTIEFFQDGYYATSGYGYETSKGWSYGHTTRTYFEWWVQDRTIILHYSDSHRYIVLVAVNLVVEVCVVRRYIVLAAEALVALRLTVPAVVNMEEVECAALQ